MNSVKIAGVPVHQILVALLLLGAAHFALGVLSDRTAGKVSTRLKSRMGV